MGHTDFDLVVVGGGASGFFAALTCAEHNPSLKIAILEKSNAFLSKVRISGGGRCNVTHDCRQNSALVKKYPRGEKALKKPFEQFAVESTVQWFSKRGLLLKTEEDGRMFPVSNRSESVIDCLVKDAEKRRVTMRTQSWVTDIEPTNPGFLLGLQTGERLHVRYVVIATGGHHKPGPYHWLSRLGLSVVDPIPSLFTFNIPNWALKDLQGIAVPNASVRILKSSFTNQGPLLITHWGLSGPAVIQLSAFAARHLHDLQYKFSIHVHWNAGLNESETREHMDKYKSAHPKREVNKYPLFDLPVRLWAVLAREAGIPEGQRWVDLSKKQLNKLIESLIRCEFQVFGKTTFKEEFVTCGGIDLSEINMETMESRKIEGLYFSGEVLNIDGITGGFNFQSAWTTGWIAGKSIALKIRT